MKPTACWSPSTRSDQAPEKALDELGNAAQHLHRDGRPLVLVMVGLPRPERAHEPTFLARAWQPALARLDDRDVERGFVDTAASAGGRFEALALRSGVEMAAGEPFLMQLIGYHAWESARRHLITAADVGQAARAARTTFNRAVTEQMVNQVSPDQRAFLASMARHGLPTRIGEIKGDHEWSQSQVGVYRQRLIDAGLIEPAGWGLVDFAIPGVADAVAQDW